MSEGIKKFITERKTFITYLLISVFVTVIDVILSRICEIWFEEVIANTIGVVVGFIIQYILCSHKVYRSKTIKTLVIFFVTWLLALGLADLIVYVVREKIFSGNDGMITFLVAKGASIVIPFFITYFVRKALIPVGSDKNKEEQVTSRE
ncbi:GtrA-like protein [Ruminococcaceae bacterium YAD3003]|nr:GtrA-like protein [Ruminococcaceae bacterium YAD3003]